MEPDIISQPIKTARLLNAVEALRNQLLNLEETTGLLHHATLNAPRDASWNSVRDEVSCLDSIGDVMRQALDYLIELIKEG
jgi:hypothetical protein